jgi:UDP-glucose 4-epimerase
MSKILLTGSAGYLGTYLYTRLKELGCSVTGIDQRSHSTVDRVVDISNAEAVEDCFRDNQFDAIIHTAALHRPHIVLVPIQRFIDVNVTGTLNLLESARKNNVNKFIFTSTTSVYGHALTDNSEGASWITEEVVPNTKNIYGVTKIAAENLCKLYAELHRLHVIVLRVSRFFAEDDFDVTFPNANMKGNEILFRRADYRDMVQAHVDALNVIESISYDVFIISGPTPFKPEDRKELITNAAAVVAKYYPDYEQVFKELGWEMFNKIDRVYVTEKAQRILGFKPKYTFKYNLEHKFADIFTIPAREFPY